MPDDNADMRRVEDLAHSLAISELLRFILGEVAFNADPAVFRGRLQIIEESVVTSLGSRRHHPAANDYTENVIEEMACGYVTRMIASIRHPTDPKS
jgi:hypothetical protein